MDPHRRQGVYEMQYRTDGTLLPSCCVECLNHEENTRSRARRRCKSEGLERSPYDIWQRNNHTGTYAPYSSYRDCDDSCKIVTNCAAYVKNISSKSPLKLRETQIINNYQNSDKIVQCDLCRHPFNTEKSYSNGKTICNNRETHIGRQEYCDKNVMYSTNNRMSPYKFIENKEPRLSNVDECNTVVIVEPRPRSTDVQSKTPLKSILVNKSRRSASPSYFRKANSKCNKPPAEWNEGYNRQSSCDGKRRVRARSESEKTMCLIANDNCKYDSCCWNGMKRPRGRSPPPLSIHQSREEKEVYDDGSFPLSHGDNNRESPLRNGKRLQPVVYRDMGMNEWSVFDGTVSSPTGKQQLAKGKAKVTRKNKQPSAKVKSRLQAMKAKKASMETCSTGSELSDDELSDGEDVVSKASMDHDSGDEAVDNQECLTSDSGPSVTSTSDTASLNGLTSALTVNGSNLSDEDALQAMIRPSLFAFVPPYLRFLSHDSVPLRIPQAIQRHLRWKVTTITPVVVRRTLMASGFRLIRSECNTQGGKQAADTTQTHDSTEWIGTWGKHMKSLCFKTLKDSQKMNHFPGTFQIGRKDRLWRNLQKLMFKFGQKEFGLMPKTYVLPHDLKLLKHDWEKYASQNEKWIIKPPASARGTGIKVVSRWTQVPKRRPVVVQRYISRPLLIDGSKFDMRLYVLVTSVHPLRIYLYPDGLARFASANRPDIVLVDHSKNTTYIVDVTIPHDENLQKAERDKILKYMDLAYEIKDMWRTPATIVVPIVISTNGLIPKNLHANLCKVGVDGGLKYLMQKAVLLSTCRTLLKYSDDNSSLHDRYMHLTNYSINRLSKSYTHNQDAEACQGHKWTLQALLSYLKKERGIDTDKLWNNMKDLVIKTILSGESSISCLTKSNIGSRFNCYELFGIDVLLDENLKPWLLEVNISPSLHSASPLDLHVKGPLVSTLFNMVQFHIPEKASVDDICKDKGPILHDKRMYTIHLSKEEKQKHIHFTEMETRSDYISDVLTDLTPDDIRHLILAEDELTQRQNLERIFPTADTYHYLNFFAGPRYYNRLFDAWETTYSGNRKAGVKRLQELCDRGVHLEVPPMPTKNDEEVKEECTTESLLSQIPPPIIPQEELLLEPMDTTFPSTTGSTMVPTPCLIEGHHILGEICLICRPNIMLQSQPLPLQQHA